MRVYRSVLLGLVVVGMVTVSTMTPAQESLRAQLFSEADRVMNVAKEKSADLYSPRNFDRAMRSYREAEEDFQAGGNLEGIRKKLKEAISYFTRAMEVSKVGELVFSSVRAARTDAMSAEAPRSSPQQWKKAEEQLRKAGEELEDGDVNAAKKKAGEAETLYRSAELEAIKMNYLSSAWDLLGKAEKMDVKDHAPKTIHKARQLVVQAEELLKQDRYDTDEARGLAQEARREAQHAIYLYETIERWRKEGKGFEEVMLSAEEALQHIAGELDMRADFHAGLDGPVEQMVAAIHGIKTSARHDEETIAQQEREIAHLKALLESMEGRIGALTEAEQELQRKLERQQKRKETIEQISGTFSPEEGEVLQEGDNVIIRLYGLTFPVGQTIIEPQFFALLAKVQKAIEKFPTSRVSVEGHADSRGSDEVNQTLSEDRARAVADYLKANMDILVPIVFHGYGESRPIASNETPEGRAKNRRIDVVIVPEEMDRD